MRIFTKRTSSRNRGFGASRAVVFFGDSITEQGRWQEWFPDLSVSNRGVGGERVEHLLARIDSAIDHPLAVLLLIGTNNLTNGEGVGEVAEQVTALVDELLIRVGGAPVVLQSVMPRSAQYSAEIVALNARYREIAEERPTVRYLDLWPALATPQGTLRSEFTDDDLHLNDDGYRAWVTVLRPLLVELGLSAPRRRASRWPAGLLTRSTRGGDQV